MARWSCSQCFPRRFWRESPSRRRALGPSGVFPETSRSSWKPWVEAKIRQISKNYTLEGSVRRRIEDNINVEGSRGRRIGENCNLEDSRRRWIDRNSVLAGCRVRWIEQKMVLEGSGGVGSTKRGAWRRPGGLGSKKLVVWRTLPRARTPSEVESACYPGAHRGSIFYMIEN